MAMWPNQGNNNTSSGNTQSGIGGYLNDPNTHQLTPLSGQSFWFRSRAGVHA